MITLEKFFKAVDKIKVEGRWTMGLIIAQPEQIDFKALKKEIEKIKVDGLLLLPAILARVAVVFQKGRWVIFEIKKELPVEIYNQLKLLSAQNRVQLSDGGVLRQPDNVRVVVLSAPETVKTIETKYPDFKYLFGPVITL